MFWVSNTWRLTASAAALAALALPGAALAGVVVASSGPSASVYPVGKKLPDDAKITLKASDSVTILDAKGSRVLRGAGTFTVGAPGVVTRTSQFALLTRQRSAARVRTGAIRSGNDGKPVSPNLWYVDLSRSGTVCVVDPATMRGWRPSNTGDQTYTAANHSGGKTALAFTDKVTVAPWDVAAAPVTDGATYTITGPAGTPSVSVTFAVIANQDYTSEDLAAALLEKGCTVQLGNLVSTMALPAETAEAAQPAG